MHSSRVKRSWRIIAKEVLPVMGRRSVEMSWRVGRLWFWRFLKTLGGMILIGGERTAVDCDVGFVAAAAIATIHKVYNETKTDEIDPNLLERSNQWNVMGLGFNS